MWVGGCLTFPSEFVLEVDLRLRTAVLISLGISLALIVAMSLFSTVVFRAATSWIEQGTELSHFQRTLIMVGAFWSKFWGLGIPAIVLIVSFLVAVYAFIRHAAIGRRGAVC
jgi:type II secretory pathway component PulF